MSGSETSSTGGADHESGAGAGQPNLGKRAVRGAAVTMAAQGGKIGIQVLSVVLLARLLSPHDYGLIAMVLAIIGVADIFRDFGLSSAAIQSPSLSRDEQINLFWVNTAFGALLAVLAVAAAPLVATMYRQPDLTTITMALAVNFVLNGVATQYRADLNRRMRFRQLALADVAGPASGLAVAVVVALAGGGYWALVAQQVTQVSVMLVLVVVGAGWLPRWYQREVPVRRFLAFGLRLAGSQIVSYIGNNTDTVVLGLTVSPSELGLYNRSFQLVTTPVGQIRGPLNSVAIPVLSRIQDDEPRFQSYVARGQMAMGYSLVVGLAFVAGAATPIVSVLLGSQWLGAIAVLQLLAIGAAFQTLSYVGYWVYVTKGLVNHLLHYTFLSTALRIVCVLIGSLFGIVGVATAMAVVPLLAWPLSFWWLSRRASIPVHDLWAGGLRVTAFAAVVGGAAAAVVVATAVWPAWASLLAALGASLLAYGALGWLVPAFRSDLRSVLALIRLSVRRA